MLERLLGSSRSFWTELIEPEGSISTQVGRHTYFKIPVNHQTSLHQDI